MRWRLTAPHYLNVPGTEWEYKETNRDTGKQVRRVFAVPLLLNPDDAADQNYPGEIIVAQGKVTGRDIEFYGEPTPDMEPLDEEAQALSDSLRHKWVHPIESLPGDQGSYAASLLEGLQAQLAQALSNRPTPVVANTGIDPAAFAVMQEQLAALMAKNAELEAAATSRRA